jgi:hypothetical protein
MEERRVQVPNVRALRGVTGDEDVPGVFAGPSGPRYTFWVYARVA